MVGHHAPFMQVVAHTLEEQESALDHSGDVRITQPTPSVSDIQVGLEALFAFRIAQDGRHRLQLLSHLFNGRSGKAVNQVKADVLDMVLALEMGKETAIPPDGITGPFPGPA